MLNSTMSLRKHADERWRVESGRREISFLTIWNALPIMFIDCLHLKAIPSGIKQIKNPWLTSLFCWNWAIQVAKIGNTFLTSGILNLTKIVSKSAYWFQHRFLSHNKTPFRAYWTSGKFEPRWLTDNSTLLTACLKLIMATIIYLLTDVKK